MQLSNISNKEKQEDPLCRFCLGTEVNELIPVFCVASTQKILVSHMALACTGIVVSCRDKLPQYTCDGCMANLDIAYACWKRCRQSWGNYKLNPALDTEVEDFRCRICLKDEVEELISLFCICDSHSMKISDIVQRFAGLDVAENDQFPQYICDVCLGELNTGFSFRKLARKSNATLRSKLIESENEQQPPIQSDSFVRTSLDNSILNESLDFKYSSEPPSPKTLEPSSTDKKAREVRTQIPGKANRSPEKPNVPSISTSSRDRIIKPSVPVIPARKNDRAVFKKLAPNPVAISDERKAPKATPSNLRSTAIVSKRVPQPKGTSPSNIVIAGRSRPDGQSSLKKASFANPAEFKRLASQILKKPDNKPSLVQLERCATLTANEIQIMQQMPRFTRAQITAFLCQNCDNVCGASAIRSTCIKCKLRFDNYLPIELERRAVLQGYVEAYCCKNCTFFAITLDKLVKHLDTHNQNASNRIAVPGPSTRNATRPTAARTQLNALVTTKRRTEEPASQTSKPVTKKQRITKPQPKSVVKVASKQLSDNWIRVEPNSKIVPPRRGAGFTIEIFDSDNDSDSEGQQPDELQVAPILESDVKLENDPLDIIDTMDVVEDFQLSEAVTTTNDVSINVTRTHPDQSELMDVSSNEGFIGFEEGQLEITQLVPLAKRSVL